VRFIDVAHNGQHEESLHPYLTCVTYFNFALGGRSSIGFYGTDKALDCVWEKYPEYSWVSNLCPEFMWLIFYKDLR
jgi:hypothetical protein